MKNYLIIFILCFVHIYFGQRKTLFEGKEQTIFIDYSNNSKFKKERADFSFSKFDRQTYQNSLDNIKKNKITLNKINIKDFSKKWIELFQYKEEFYTYYYCDFCGDYRLEFRKNMLLESTCEGPYVIAVDSFKKESSKTFSFDRTDEFGEKGKVIIHIIDVENGIAIFETIIDNETSYKLMLDVSKIDKFPMIINDCNSKQREFKEFDEPNFKELLNRK